VTCCQCDCAPGGLVSRASRRVSSPRKARSLARSLGPSPTARGQPCRLRPVPRRVLLACRQPAVHRPLSAPCGTLTRALQHCQHRARKTEGQFHFNFKTVFGRGASLAKGQYLAKECGPSSPPCPNAELYPVQRRQTAAGED
jgi:hypothetical protein